MNLLRGAQNSHALCNIKKAQKTETSVAARTRSRVLLVKKPSPAVSVLAFNGPNGGNGAVDMKSMTEQTERRLLALKRALTLPEQDKKRGQRGLRVAYQGIPGAYSEEAAVAAHPGCQGLPCDTFDTAVQSVARRVADRAILPVESTAEGSIHPNYDLLLDYSLQIVGEIQYPVRYCLLALPGVAREEIKRVMSHPLALSHCRKTLTRLGLPNISKQTTEDTAGAAECVSRSGLRDTGAIASTRAAEIYGLRVLARGIEDESCNFTRFLVLAREPIVPPADRPCKTSIVVAHDGDLGVLFRLLSAFSFRDINLTKLESRPRRNLPRHGSGLVKDFQYVFYIDFEASVCDKRVQNALTELSEFATFMRVLGSYPVDASARL
ncbi:hypothetical protein SUGI_1203620 [Cryptomeria japonica]|uniref:arogenate dehydratase 3, chloroplastic n=1 Tax=Cryptomeria japonica TaxID=3369 RepID=UPI002414CB44|nr:arogenate dehydratase 3, chloroplastic [Cryptomeria japonica]GLJ56062.1 hypothetical protein SUGI_1203620 [Cryptomeria japonica]